MSCVCLQGDLRFNDGVQGGAPSYRNTLRLLGELGFEVSWLDMTVSFGTGERHWSNVGAETALVRRCRGDIRRFGELLRRVARREWYYAFVPVSKLLRRNNFSEEFASGMVYPLTALFFGTGSQTSRVSSVLVARVFNDPKLRLFEYDEERLLSQAPKMFAFPPLADVYARLGAEIEAQGGTVRVGCPVQSVVRRRGRAVEVVCGGGERLNFDEVVFATNTEVSQRLLKAGGSRLGFVERRLLSGVEYFDDVTVTHTDAAYMSAHYEMAGKPMYYIKTYNEHGEPSKGEMSFDLSSYQPHARADGESAIYQSIFLNRTADERMWTRGDIDESKIVLVKWWRMFAHTVSHLVRSPLWRFAQGARSTFYAGSYTLVNTHEIAIISGLAAAYRLGADYAFADDQLAADQFDLFLSINHGRRRKRVSPGAKGQAGAPSTSTVPAA